MEEMMHALFIIMIAVALSLDIFGALCNRGALLVKFDKKVAEIVASCAALQLTSACVGYWLGSLLLQNGTTEHSAFWVHAFAGVLLAAIGVRMLIQAFKKNGMTEHRMDEVDIRTDLKISLLQCINALLAGVVCGIMTYNFLYMVIAIALGTAIFAAVGYFSGRSFGPTPSHKAYAIGGGMLCIISIVLQL